MSVVTVLTLINATREQLSLYYTETKTFIVYTVTGKLVLYMSTCSHIL